MKKEGKSRSEQFIEEGLWRYEEAKATLVAFERSIKERLKRALEEYREEHDKWGSFVPLKEGEIRHSPAGADYAWLNAFIPGEMRKSSGKTQEISVTLGIIWYEKHRPVFYIEYFNQAAPLINPAPKPPVEVHGNRLELEAEKNDVGIDRALFTLLNEFSRFY